ncbi:MAG TPA: ArsI/CadI family heavy metal resistance metalloenzyme [Leptospiraceae bacterium]|nr:ArsI/CadI family heavy metal resistance metalloenzyme [Leptospiraceae bacterium]HMX33623.1 ArsI/CadI family heavy metal resistance metalloenzyme [Leptospiraceae bacterium]HMY33782.1 ArsI/CadI family heavy metal resistance metalloenzyme [Leptospiraceae bacterium]HMZ64844.1 ArsI/CadI family heavy metal resistance metalloenzyme [Leptospiraceae bacterium]HNA10149.1 ArsI/CadI family heavy metal resistance metalloenzyme [Leptospiraceae bacterium]
MNNVLEKSFPQVGILKPHIAIVVKNVEESIAFYTKMFGKKPSKVRSGYAKFDLEFPSLNLTLNESGKNVPHGALSHLGIQVSSTEDVLKVKKYWEELGLTARDELGVSCCYAIQDKTWVKDPDGNEWEVFVVLEDNLPEFKFIGGTANACCSTSSSSGQSCC